MFNPLEHQIKRQRFYTNVANFWHDLNGEEYALYDLYTMSSKEIAAIRRATDRAGHIFIKTTQLLRKLDRNTLQELDIPEHIIPFLRTKSIAAETLIARIDLVRTKEGLKVLEINSDTPTFEKEVFHVNGAVAKHFGYDDPNEGLELELGATIHNTVTKSILSLNKPEKSNIIFTSHDDHEEDRMTTKYLMDISKLNARYIPLKALQLWEEGGTRLLLDDNGQPVDVLYRQTYPLEHLMEDKDPGSGEAVGIKLLQLFNDKNVICFNPLSAFLLQSKAVQAIIWGLFESNNHFFSDLEKEWIKEYFLPTYLDEEPFLKKAIPYVKKPSFGREGDTIEIYDSAGKKIKEDKNKTYRSSVPVYQQYAQLPSTNIKTVNGVINAHLLIGCFLIKGKASALGLRAGNLITDNNAFFLPLGTR